MKYSTISTLLLVDDFHYRINYGKDAKVLYTNIVKREQSRERRGGFFSIRENLGR